MPPSSPLLCAFQAVMGPVPPGVPRSSGRSCCKGLPAAMVPTTRCIRGRYGSSAARCPPSRREFMLQGIPCRQVPHYSVRSRPLWVRCCILPPFRVGHKTPMDKTGSVQPPIVTGDIRARPEQRQGVPGQQGMRREGKICGPITMHAWWWA